MEFLKQKFAYIFYNTDIYKIIIDKATTILFLLIGAYLINKILLKLIDYLTTTSLKANKKLGLNVNNKRSDTVRKLIKSIVRYVVYFIVFIEILSLFGINTTGILASAGLVSVAVGFGAQSLVKDIITGFFLILEGQFDVGDYVKISNQAAFIAEGVVVTLGLRSTKIRSNSGEVYFIPNSSINQVVNYSQTYNLASVELEITIKDSYKNLEMEINNLLNVLNLDERYSKNFYKKEVLKLNKVISIINNVAKIEIIVKSKLMKNELIESMLKQDFFEKFKERLV